MARVLSLLNEGERRERERDDDVDDDDDDDDPWMIVVSKAGLYYCTLCNLLK